MSIFGNPVKEKEFDDLSWTTLISVDRGCCLMMFKFPGCSWKYSKWTILFVKYINRWLPRFIVEVGKGDGVIYLLKSYYLLPTGILRYMYMWENWNELQFINEKIIIFWRSLNAQMKVYLKVFIFTFIKSIKQSLARYFY